IVGHFKFINKITGNLKHLQNRLLIFFYIYYYKVLLHDIRYGQVAEMEGKQEDKRRETRRGIRIYGI
uniref:hypothetical protein n=1 Tax=Enterobacter asburiae TaxID=61645 RepID=UPI002FC63874